jgi:type II secretory pathway pseudopilin PulG
VNKRTGFSTPELLITLMIFSFGLLPLIVLFQSSNKQTAQAKNLMVAHSLGRTKIAEIRSLGFAVLENEIKTSSMGIACVNKEVTGPLVDSDSDSIVYPEYYKKFNTTIKLEKPTDDKIRIELDVTWQEPSRTFSLGFGSVVVNYGS